MLRLQKNKGVSLIEVMITLLILAIGLLGVFSVQINSKRVKYDSEQRSIASGLVLSMVERMRSNAEILENYATANTGVGTVVLAAACTSAANCDAEDLATYDLWDWKREIDGVTQAKTVGEETLSVGGLVSPTACISHNDGMVTVTIAWYGSMAMSNPANNDCGTTLGIYGAENNRRQIFTLTTYIQNGI